ncbi:MAG: histidine ammonia-lyase [Candidatus Limnocylindrales bacterium]|nr:histidine ammonia-lyase [Candidatus Limnocylindrales bacterium]
MTQPRDQSGPSNRAHDRPKGPYRARDAAGAEVVVLTGADLTIADVEAVARGDALARLDFQARARMLESRAVVERLVAAGEVVYGITTGFGDLAGTHIPPADARQLQENLLVSHAVGVGAPLPRDVVRAMLLLRANTLALGHSGCRPLVVDRLLAFLEAGIHPVVPSQGSVGASGDLAPLAHLALPLIGRGEVELGGQLMPGLLALRETGIEPLTLEAKEGLALLNGTQLMSALGALLLADADRLARTASVAAAQSVEALLATDVPFAAVYQLARPHPGQIAVAAEMRHLLRDSGLMAAHHGSSHKVQDPYSLRCVPQVHGAVRDALDYLGRVLDVELNSATDNPLIFPGGGATAADVAATGGGLVISGGNFHGEPIALALDFAKLAIAELGAISERRVALLLDARLNGGLPPFLAPASGLNSGMMLLQYTAAALASENKVLVHPASADSIPTSANQEDHVSMGPIAGRHARDVLANVERILAIELLAGAQALDLRLEMTAGVSRDGAGVAHGPVPGRGVADAHRRIRSVVAPLLVDREMGADIAAALALVRSGELAGLVDAPGAASPGAG